MGWEGVPVGSAPVDGGERITLRARSPPNEASAAAASTCAVPEARPIGTRDAKKGAPDEKISRWADVLLVTDSSRGFVVPWPHHAGTRVLR